MIWNSEYVLGNLDSSDKHFAFAECGAQAFCSNGVFLFIENIPIVIRSDCACVNDRR